MNTIFTVSAIVAFFKKMAIEKSSGIKYHRWTLYSLLLFAIMSTPMLYGQCQPMLQNKEEVARLNSFVDPNLKDRDVLEKQLKNQKDHSSFYLFSHGESGKLFINNQWLSNQNLVAFLQPLLQGKNHLNIYGCHFAQGEKGRAALAYLETALGITVAASDDLTGVDGDWDLEVGNFKNGITIQEYSHNLQQGTLPIEHGMAAVTCGSGVQTNLYNSDPNGYVLGIYDIREPGCAGTPGANAPNAPANWTGASGSNAYHDSRWTNANLGEVFGVDLEYDQASSPDIFLSSCGLSVEHNSDQYPMAGGTGGEVFRINGTTGDITVLAALPSNAFPSATGRDKFTGLGNLSYNADQQKVYVTNLDDGNIYVVDATTTGVIDQTYNPTPGIPYAVHAEAYYYTTRNRMVYGIEYNKCDKRLYFARPNTLTTVDILSVGLNADGTIGASAPTLETTVTVETNVVISDIEFSDDCTQMLTSERKLIVQTTSNVFLLQTEPHFSEVKQHDLSGGTWSLAAASYSIGNCTSCTPPDTNAGGGVSFGYGNYGACGTENACADAMVATSDALVLNNGINIYGLQISDIDGTSSGLVNSYFVDLDGNTGSGENADKSTSYDVDVFGVNDCSVVPCSIDADGLASISCTGTNAITFSLTPTGTSTSVGGNYNVTVSSGTITPPNGAYGAATNFTLNDNSAGGGDVTVTLTDVTESSCTRDVTVTDPGTCLASCSLSMSQTSTCSESGGVHTQTYDLTLNWIDPPATGDLTITLTGDGTLNTSTVPAATIAGGSTTTLPGAFTVPADGNGTTTITATFDDDSACTSTFTLNAPVPCPADVNPCASTAGCIGGKVFEDFNCNGADDADAGIQSVQIEVYDCNNNLVGTGNSDSDGDWQVCGLTDGDTYRIEVVVPANLSPSHVGTDNGSSVQFVQPGSCTDFALLNPLTACFNPTAQKLMTTCFTIGDPLTGGINATDPTIINFNYAAATLGDAKTISATAEETGSVWGLAYTSQTDVLYMAAMLKRHSGLGPNGLGAIYSSSPYSSPPSLFYDLSAHVSVGTIPDNPSRGLGSNLNDTSHDVDAFNKVGKVGIGDIDITPDGSTLYVVNLFDKLVYAIDINNPSAAPLALPALPDPGCTNGEARPWGLKYHNGALYASLTCTAENGGTRDDLEANVYKYNGTSWSASILQIPLNYSRGSTDWTTDGSSPACNWNPWVDDWTGLTSLDGGDVVNQPSPILSDIEFDDEGNMILGFIDRVGHQTGHWNYSTDVNSTTTYRTNQGGDILKAHNNNGTYVLENNGTVGGQTASGLPNSNNPWNGTGGPNSLQGPGGGEFFWADYITTGGTAPAGSNEEGQHSELASGGLAISAADNIVLAGAMDPNGYDQGGVIWLDNTNGSRAYSLTLYAGDNNNNLFGKATGIGDLEAITSCAPLPLEIGNYVWCDTNGNGIQDACESGISDILVQLYDITGTLVGQDTTVNGQYYFNQNNVDITGITVDGSGIASPTTAWSGMSYSTQYFIVFGAGGQFATNQFTVGGEMYGITAMANAGSNDNIDSDVDGSSLTTGSLGARPDGLPFIDMTTSATGCGDHKYDLGVTCTSPTYSLGNQVFTDTDNSGDLNGGETGIDDVVLQLLNSDGSVYDSDPNTAGDQALTVTTANGGYYRFDDLPAGDYIVEVVATNFTSGNNLENFLSSTGANQEADPDTDGDLNDNGLDTQVSGATRSAVVTLGTPEPTGEAEPGTYGGGSTTGTAAADTESNLTVDFGFYPCPTLILAGTKDPTTCGGTDGDIQLSGLAASTDYVLNFMKDGTAQTAQNITADPSGEYVITGLDAAAYTAINVTGGGCTSNSVVATLTEPSSVTLAVGTAVNPTTCSGTDGTIQLTGLAASTDYVLNFMKDGTAQTAQNITADPSGEYVITGLDAAAYTAINVTAGGCTSNSVVATLTEPSSVTLAVGTAVNPTTCSGTDGTIQLTGLAAGTDYVLNFMKDGTAQTAQNITADPSGEYVITGLDAAAYTAINVTAGGCTSNNVVATLTEPMIGTAMTTPTAETCALNDGSIQITITGGSTPFDFSWDDSNGNSGNSMNEPSPFSISSLPAGTYSVTVVDNASCSITTSETVTAPSGCCASITNPTAAQNICEGQNIATLQINTDASSSIDFVYFTTAQTGSSMYSSGTSLGVATPSGGVASISNVGFPAAGVYYVYAILSPTPADGTCRPFQEIVVTVNANPSAALAVSNPQICGGDDASIEIMNSESGVSYQLRLDSDDSNVGSPLAGNGGTITFMVASLTAGSYTYNVFATNLTTGCTTELTNMATIQVDDCDFPDYNSGGVLPTCITPPCHIVGSDIYLGSGVTSDPPTSGDTNADSDMDDGVNFPNNIRPNITVQFPVTIFNNTGSDAYLSAWVDWNGDGDFDDAGENIVTANAYPFATNSGTFMASLSVNVPATAVQGQDIGVRFRLSSIPAAIASPCGSTVCAADGEIEDYLIQIECPPAICLPPTITINNK